MNELNIKNQELSNVKVIVFATFNQMEEKLDCRTPKSFHLILLLFLLIKGKINFLQPARFSDKCEQRFRYFFKQLFDFMMFNITLIQMNVRGKTALAFDLSYVSKSGKKTPGVGYFWSGVVGKVKWGLELFGLAVLNVTRQTAFHLHGFQTIDLKEDETLIEFYVRKLLTRKDALLKVSKYLIVDAYFSKFSFVESLSLTGFYVVCRLRDDADLRYLFDGKQKGKGRPNKYDGKIDFQNFNNKYFQNKK